MGCTWKTVRGRRIRTGPVGGPVAAGLLQQFSVADLLAEIQARMISGSPTFTAEELREAILRLWLDAEKGYIVEARRAPNLPPVYRAITQAEATKLEVGRPSGSFIARMFDWPEVPDQ